MNIQPIHFRRYEDLGAGISTGEEVVAADYCAATDRLLLSANGRPELGSGAHRALILKASDLGSISDFPVIPAVLPGGPRTIREGQSEKRSLALSRWGGGPDTVVSVGYLGTDRIFVSCSRVRRGDVARLNSHATSMRVTPAIRAMAFSTASFLTRRGQFNADISVYMRHADPKRGARNLSLQMANTQLTFMAYRPSIHAHVTALGPCGTMDDALLPSHYEGVPLMARGGRILFAEHPHRGKKVALLEHRENGSARWSASHLDGVHFVVSFDRGLGVLGPCPGDRVPQLTQTAHFEVVDGVSLSFERVKAPNLWALPDGSFLCAADQGLMRFELARRREAELLHCGHEENRPHRWQCDHSSELPRLT